MEVNGRAPALATRDPASFMIREEVIDLTLSDSNATTTESMPVAGATTKVPSYLLDQLPTPRVVEKLQPLEDSVGDEYIPVGVLPTADTPRYAYPTSEVSRLRAAKWIQTLSIQNTSFSALRVYVLPDDVCRATVSRGNNSLRRALKLVMAKIDSSVEAWEGHLGHDINSVAASKEDESLFYIFNTLESPNPDINRVSDPYAQKAMDDILFGGSDDDSGTAGLKTELYPYQRRSAALMIQRESQPGDMLDPRFQQFTGPTGRSYFYDREEGNLVQEKRLYSEPCGGILAETMGYGKTLICLAVILATKGHFPRIPSEYIADTQPVRNTTGSLLDMAAAAAGRLSLPWKAHFDHLKTTGMDYDRCRAACERNRGGYTIPAPVQKYKSRVGASSRIKPKHLLLSSGTIIVLPMNLIDHWLFEIQKHSSGLKILVLRNIQDITPSVEELLQYDTIIFAKARFDKEAMGCGFDPFVEGKERSTSPLTQIHWLRIIVDEGHNFAGHGQKTGSVHMLELLHVERRWVVSGTPSSGLYGAEVTLASQNTEKDAEDKTISGTDLIESRRKVGSLLDEELKDIDKLRLIVVEFLNTKPWSNPRSDDPANWSKYMKVLGDDGRRRKAPYLRSTMQSLVVRHRLEDIDRDITLPRLNNRVVYLEPTSYDRMSLNLFVFFLTVNAITSERTGEDYMFHPKNRKHLSLLLNNLRHAGFWWTGFGKPEIESAVNHAKEYMQNNEARMSLSDRDLLEEGISVAESVMNSSRWNSFNLLHELGIFVQDFPEHARSMWALDSREDLPEPMLLGISQARNAQKFVTSRLDTADPAEGLAGAGIKTRREMTETRDRSRASAGSGSSESHMNIGSKKPADNLHHRAKPEIVSPRKSSKKASKKTFSKGYTKSLPKESDLSKTKFVATASAKLSYLLQQVLNFHTEEKIIIFYENNNFAYWIAEGLELLGVEFRIYANTLKTKQRSEYLAHFNESDKIRVLLMDLGQAAHGLHIACASRVFIVNPIWRPTIESQAIKRAHRISQTRPVFVETLVLQGTFEDKMLRRRKQMSDAELQHAEKDMLEDNTMNFIVRNTGFLQTPVGESSPRPAYLKDSPGFFDRHALPVPDDHGTPSKLRQLPTPPYLPKRKAAPTFDIPETDSNVESSRSSSSEDRKPKRRKVVMLPGCAETENLEMKTGNSVVLSPPPSATPLLSPGTNFGGVQSNLDSGHEIGGTPPVTPSFPMVKSLFGGS
ncbi:hypothetical protein FQN54_000314 [Arachnomyces sp. PD_36]|nr:hypothetical protein FQN54_000314 [Arachnomyces sp. PD_36]